MVGVVVLVESFTEIQTTSDQQREVLAFAESKRSRGIFCFLGALVSWYERPVTIHRTSAIVFEGSLSPALLMAFTRYSNWVVRGWSFSEAFVSREIAGCYLHALSYPRRKRPNPPFWPGNGGLCVCIVALQPYKMVLQHYKMALQPYKMVLQPYKTILRPSNHY